jgi:uncharacterized protein
MNERQLPTRLEALNLLAKAGCSPNVIAHCESVSALAVRIAKASEKRHLKVDVSLVEISALLHDIGRSKTHSIDHAIIGGEIAHLFGLSKSVILVIERHAGGGISREEAKKLGWPVKDYLPNTIEEKLVCYADKRIEGQRIVPIERVIKMYAAVLGNNHSTIKRIWQLHHEIKAAIGNFTEDDPT